MTISESEPMKVAVTGAGDHGKGKGIDKPIRRDAEAVHARVCDRPRTPHWIVGQRRSAGAMVQVPIVAPTIAIWRVLNLPPAQPDSGVDQSEHALRSFLGDR
jgi:hypothetical protein